MDRERNVCVTVSVCGRERDPGALEGAETTTSSREENERLVSAVPLLMLGLLWSVSGVCVTCEKNGAGVQKI